MTYGERLVIDAVDLNDGHAVSGDAEGKEAVGGAVDHSETIALALLDVQPSPRDLGAAVEATFAVDGTAIGDLSQHE
jgi:hypothetical protein